MNLEQANRCVKLAQFLETLKENKWDYSNIRLNSYEEGEKKITEDGICIKAKCNTTACALGWCPEVFPDKFRPNIIEYDLIDNMLFGGEIDVEIENKCGNKWNRVTNKNLSNWFGFSEEVVDKVFWGDDTQGFYNKERMSDVTAKDVAKKLYDLVRKAGYDVVSE